MNGAVLAARSASRSHSGHSCWRGAHNWSCLLPQEPFGRAYPLIPGRNCPTASHYLHLPPCRCGVRFMGHCRIESITLLPWGVWPSNPKWCHLLWDFMLFPTVHSSFICPSSTSKQPREICSCINLLCCFSGAEM